MEKIKYINDDINLGIRYDWKKIFRRCKKLGIFPDDDTIWNPSSVPVYDTKWNVIMSIRSKGKTTNVLLLGLVMYTMYGTQTIYLGQNKDKIRPKNTADMYNIVRAHHYIEKITDGRFNDIKLYSGGKWYLLNVDEDGNIIEKDNKPCCLNMAVSEHMDYKSTWNTPTGDLIVYDEFISKSYYPNEFLDLCDLLSTVIRNRVSPVIFMLSNTINKYHQYFNELDIFEPVQALQAGESIINEGLNGSRVYVTIIDPKVNEQKKLFNKLFFGFKNPGLGAITGETTWSEFNYPHPVKSEDQKTVLPNCYIYHNKKYVNLEIVSNHLGLCIHAHWSKKVYDDSVIYTLDPIYDKRYRYKLGTPSTNTLDKLVNDLIKTNKLYYVTNDVGSFMSSYFTACKLPR